MLPASLECPVPTATEQAIVSLNAKLDFLDDLSSCIAGAATSRCGQSVTGNKGEMVLVNFAFGVVTSSVRLIVGSLTTEYHTSGWTVQRARLCMSRSRTPRLIPPRGQPKDEAP